MITILMLNWNIWNESYDSFQMFQFMSFPPSGILRTHNGLLSGWLDQLMTMDRALRPVVHRQGRVLFRSSLSFSVVFQSLRLFILSIFYWKIMLTFFLFIQITLIIIKNKLIKITAILLQSVVLLKGMCEHVKEKKNWRATCYKETEILLDVLPVQTSGL